MRRAALAWALLALAVTATAGSAPAGAGEAGVRRLIAPEDGRVYLGMSVRLWDTNDPAWGDTRPFAERIGEVVATELSGKRPGFLRVWATWQRPDDPGKPLVPFNAWAADVAAVERVVGQGGFVFLDWTLTATTRANGGITVKDVASGGLDEYIRAYADSIRAYRAPVLIRLFGGEFNGEWWWAQSPRANPSLTPADFAAAWRRVVDIFRRQGALNASWAWIPNAFPALPVPWVDADIAAYYPGDGYVDWVGADLYDAGPVSWLDGPYAFAVGHGKPFFLAEWGVRHNGSTLGPAEQSRWLDAVFDYVESHPAIKALSYFDENSRPSFGSPLDPAKLVCRSAGQVCYLASVNDMDHRLLADSGAGFAATFARRVASERYVTTARVVREVGPIAVATLSRSVVVGRVATVNWRGNSHARRYDLQSQTGGRWRLVLRSTGATRSTLTGSRGERALVRVRARNVLDVPGPWSAARVIVFRG